MSNNNNNNNNNTVVEVSALRRCLWYFLFDRRSRFWLCICTSVCIFLFLAMIGLTYVAQQAKQQQQRADPNRIDGSRSRSDDVDDAQAKAVHYFFTSPEWIARNKDVLSLDNEVFVHPAVEGEEEHEREISLNVIKRELIRKDSPTQWKGNIFVDNNKANKVVVPWRPPLEIERERRRASASSAGNGGDASSPSGPKSQQQRVLLRNVTLRWLELESVLEISGKKEDVKLVPDISAFDGRVKLVLTENGDALDDAVRLQSAVLAFDALGLGSPEVPVSCFWGMWDAVTVDMDNGSGNLTVVHTSSPPTSTVSQLDWVQGLYNISLTPTPQSVSGHVYLAGGGGGSVFVRELWLPTPLRDAWPEDSRLAVRWHILQSLNLSLTASSGAQYVIAVYSGADRRDDGRILNIDTVAESLRDPSAPRGTHRIDVLDTLESLPFVEQVRILNVVSVLFAPNGYSGLNSMFMGLFAAVYHVRPCHSPSPTGLPYFATQTMRQWRMCDDVHGGTTACVERPSFGAPSSQLSRVCDVTVEPSFASVTIGSVLSEDVRREMSAVKEFVGPGWLRRELERMHAERVANETLYARRFATTNAYVEAYGGVREKTVMSVLWDTAHADGR
eukprot:PhM_4_TR3333/c1_g1_i1/m.84163